MQTLIETSSEVVRKNWNEYKNDVQIDTTYYNMLWEELYKKFNIDGEEKFIKLLRNLIERKNIKTSNTVVLENETTLILKNIDTCKRRTIHDLCDHIGLHHVSKTLGKHKQRVLYIYLPTDWCWEFTKENIYDNEQLKEERKKKEEEYKKRKEQKRERREKRKKETFCDGCGICAFDTMLFMSIHFNGIYCENCLETEIGEDGYELSAHKCEPIDNCYYN